MSQTDISICSIEQTIEQTIASGQKTISIDKEKCREFIIALISNNRLDLLIKLYSVISFNLDFYATPFDVCDIAARHGFLDIVKWFHFERNGSLHYEREFNVCGTAAKHGFLDIILWVRNHKHSNGRCKCYFDSDLGDLHDEDNILFEAIRGNQFHIVQWVHDDRDPRILNNNMCIYAAQHGNFEILKWAVDFGYPLSPAVASCLAYGGFFDILKWVCSVGCTYDVLTCAMAANGGHLDILQWLRSINCPWDEQTTYYAALNARLDILKWAVENGCDIRKTIKFGCPNIRKNYIVLGKPVSHGAALSGSIDVMSWLREIGCEWDELTC